MKTRVFQRKTKRRTARVLGWSGVVIRVSYGRQRHVGHLAEVEAGVLTKNDVKKMVVSQLQATSVLRSGTTHERA